MKIFITALILSLLCFFLLSSCGYTNNLPDRSSGLANIIAVTRPIQSEGSDDYLFLQLTPEFRPYIQFYTVDVDSTYIFGFKPVTALSNTSVKVLVDSSVILPEKWNEIDEYFTCHNEEDVSEKTIEIILSDGEDKRETIYRLYVKFNNAAESYNPECLLDTLQLVSWSSITREVRGMSTRGAFYDYSRNNLKKLTPIPPFSPATFNYSVHVGDKKYFGIDNFAPRSIESDQRITYYNFKDDAYSSVLDLSSSTSSIIKLKYVPDSCDTQVYTITVMP